MDNPLPEPIFISAPKAANLCGVTRNTVCCWIRDNKLPSFRTAGGKYLIRPQDLIGFMEANHMFIHPSLEELAARDQVNQNLASGTNIQPDGNIAQEPAILVVDDDPEMRNLTRRTLEPLGLPILQAEDGYDALHQLVQNPLIALVILDLIMPGQAGEKTFIEIRKAFPVLPVIICTGQDIEEARNRFIEQKPDLIITKPYHPTHLINSAATFVADLGF